MSESAERVRAAERLRREACACNLSAVGRKCGGDIMREAADALDADERVFAELERLCDEWGVGSLEGILSVRDLRSILAKRHERILDPTTGVVETADPDTATTLPRNDKGAGE